MTRWDQNQCELLTVHYSSSNVGDESQGYQTTDKVGLTVAMYDEANLERFLGCTIIALMPKEGLQETLYWLRDALDFYYLREPLQKRLKAGGARPEIIEATIVGERPHPILTISE